MRDGRFWRCVGGDDADELQHVRHGNRRRASDCNAYGRSDCDASTDSYIRADGCANGYASTGNRYPCADSDAHADGSANGHASTGNRYAQANGDIRADGHPNGDTQACDRYAQANGDIRADGRSDGDVRACDRDAHARGDVHACAAGDCGDAGGCDFDAGASTGG